MKLSQPALPLSRAVEQCIVKEQTDHTKEVGTVSQVCTTHLCHSVMLGISTLPKHKPMIAHMVPPDEFALLLRD